MRIVITALCGSNIVLIIDSLCLIAFAKEPIASVPALRDRVTV